MITGILAVQGAFEEHGAMLQKLGADFRLIRKKSDWTGDIDRVILPGGESTVQNKLIRELDLFDDIKKCISEGMPVLGTCAGLILLAEKTGDDRSLCFRTLPVKIVRNGYGRQLGSFSVSGSIGSINDYPMRFIRAPYIEKILDDKAGMLNVTNNRITAVRYNNQLGLTFHPELTQDTRIHELFLSL